MRYLKAAAVMLACIILAGLMIQQLPEFETAIVVVGVAAAILLARRQIRAA